MPPRQPEGLNFTYINLLGFSSFLVSLAVFLAVILSIESILKNTSILFLEFKVFLFLSRKSFTPTVHKNKDFESMSMSLALLVWVVVVVVVSLLLQRRNERDRGWCFDSISIVTSNVNNIIILVTCKLQTCGRVAE